MTSACLRIDRFADYRERSFSGLFYDLCENCRHFFAANAADSGSMTFLNSIRFLHQGRFRLTLKIHDSTSGSSKVQCSIGLIRVPSLGRECTRPFADSNRTAIPIGSPGDLKPSARLKFSV